MSKKLPKELNSNLVKSPFEDTEKVESNQDLEKVSYPPQDYSNLVRLSQGFQSLDNQVEQLNFTKEENKKYHEDFQDDVKNLNNEIEQYKNNFQNHRLSKGYVSNFQKKFNDLQDKFDARQREINKSIFSDQKTGAQENYINNLKKLYITFDQLSKKIQTSGETLGLSQDEQNVIKSLSTIKSDLFTELNKFEKITEGDLQEKNRDKDNAIANQNESSVKNLQLYLDEAKFITSNLTEALDYDEKNDRLNQIKDLFKEMTDPVSGVEFKKILTDNLKNIVPLSEGKKNSTKKNYNINQELDRMLAAILKEQEELLSLLVSNQVLKIEEDTETKKGVNETSKLFNDPTDKTNLKQLRDAKQRYIALHQQEYKLRTIQESPDKYIANNAVTEKLNKDIKTLRKEIIVLRQNASSIEKESEELEKKKFASGIVARVFNRIFYGSDEAIDKKVQAMEDKKEQIDNRVLALTTTYEKQNEKRVSYSQVYNAIRTNSPDKLKSVIPDIDPIELYNKVIEQRGNAKAQIPKKESWVKRLFGRKSKSQGQARYPN